MAQKRNEPTWPLLCILICLFVLSATSPSIWERTASKRRAQTAAGKSPAATVQPDTQSAASIVVADQIGTGGPRSTEALTWAEGRREANCPAVVGKSVAAFQRASVVAPLANRVTLPNSSPALRPESEPASPSRDDGKPSERPAAAQVPSSEPFIVNRSDGNSTRAPTKPPTFSPPLENGESKRPAVAASEQRPAISTSDWRPSVAPAQPPKVASRFESVESLRALLLPTEPLDAGMPKPTATVAQATPVRAADKPPAAIAPPAASESKSAASTVKPPPPAQTPPTPAGMLPPRVDKPPPPADAPKPNVDKPSSVESRQDRIVSAKSPTPPEASATPRPLSQEESEKWPKPQSLYAQLAGLAHEPETRDWASNVEGLVHKLGPALSEGSREALPLTAKLEQLSERGSQLATELGERPAAARLRRAVYSLDRRLAIWKPMVRAGGIKASFAKTEDEDLRQLETRLEEVNAVLEESSEGPGWRRFLELDGLRKLVSDRGATTRAQATAIARKILDRAGQVPMKASQRRFLAQGPMAGLFGDLRRLAAEPVPFEDVLRHVELFEQAGTPNDAKILARDCERLIFSRAGQAQVLGQGIEEYYRNANVRLVVAVELLNRFIPERAKEYGDVADVVGGKNVYGRSLTATRVGLRLIPDPQQVHVALDVNGYVSSSTQSIAGPATFYSDSQSVYRGWKEIEIGTEGMLIHPAQVAVNNDLTLRGLSTDFDELPLIGVLAQEVARSQHEQKRCEMNSEVEQKVAARARGQIDQEAETRLGTAAQRVRAAVLDPLSELSLGPTLVSAETTERRVSMRLRVASDGQLGGYTPRPQAPTDSAVSFQVHESALNNALEQLQLDGVSFTLPQLRKRIASRLMRDDLFRGDSENDDVTIAFAPRNAVQVACREGQLILTLAIARLAKPPHSWDDFQVRVLLRPRVQGRMIEFMREDVIQLTGTRLNTRAQIGLRSVFGKTFPKQRPIVAVPERVINEPRLQDLVFTQLVIEDGWIGGALGAGRVARKSAAPDQPETRAE